MYLDVNVGLSKVGEPKVEDGYVEDFCIFAASTLDKSKHQIPDCCRHGLGFSKVCSQLKNG